MALRSAGTMEEAGGFLPEKVNLLESERNRAPYEVESEWKSIPKERYKKDLGTQIKLISPVDPAFAAENPDNPYRIRTNRKIDA